MTLIDTNILIEFYKNNQSVTNRLREISQDQLAISVVTVGELIYGALNKKELRQILASLNGIRQLPLTPAICDLQLALLREYTLSHRLSLPDAFIAATAIHHQFPLYTLNRKDFKYLPNLKLVA